MRVDVEGLLVKVSETAVFGRAGLLLGLSFSFMLRCNVSLPELNISPSPMSKPSRNPGLSASAEVVVVVIMVVVVLGGEGSSGIRTGDLL